MKTAIKNIAITMAYEFQLSLLNVDGFELGELSSPSLTVVVFIVQNTMQPASVNPPEINNAYSSLPNDAIAPPSAGPDIYAALFIIFSKE